jgi:hypothetical protein
MKTRILTQSNSKGISKAFVAFSGKTATKIRVLPGTVKAPGGSLQSKEFKSYA